jgi:SAM-dependent methyltransferase
MKIITYIILSCCIIIFIHMFKIFKLYDQRFITKKYEYVQQHHININTKNTEIQHQPFNYSDVYEYGIYRTHPFKHANDHDYHLAELNNNMTILDAGCGILGPALYFTDRLPNIKICALTNAKGKYKNEIISKVKANKLNKKIIPYFKDFNQINTTFKKETFDRVLFIESIGYSDDIINLLSTVKNKLKKNGKIYIRTLTIPKTKNNFLIKSYDKIQKNIDMKIYYHENMIYFLQKAGYVNIKFTSIPLMFSENLNNPVFLLSLRKLNILSVSNLIASVPIASSTYIASIQ